jgi:predicted aminopeptidase
MAARGRRCGRTCAAIEAGLKRNADFLALVAETRERTGPRLLAARHRGEKRAAKAAAIERLRARYRQMRDESWGG